MKKLLSKEIFQHVVVRYVLGWVKIVGVTCLNQHTSIQSRWSPERRTLLAAVSSLHSMSSVGFIAQRKGLGIMRLVFKLVFWNCYHKWTRPSWFLTGSPEKLGSPYVPRSSCTSGRLTLVATLAVHLSRMAGVTWHKLAGHWLLMYFGETSVHPTRWTKACQW